MAKQKFELTSSIVTKELKKNTPQPIKEKRGGESVVSKARSTLNFKISQSFKSEFKAWCAKKDLSMTAALEKAFELLKHKHGD